MLKSYNFLYNNNNYNFEYNENDPSGMGCINEIVIRNEYNLENYNNHMNKTFIDIGANCGVVTIILAKQNPLSKIYSFEPDRQLFEILNNNVSINNLTNVVTFNKAVTKEGIDNLELCLHPFYSGGNTTYSNINNLNSHFHTKINTYRVDCISLDKIITDSNITEIELLKIDCEGAEYDIIYDSKLLKNKIINNMVGEFHNLKYNIINHTAEELINYCKPFINNIFQIGVLNI